MSVMARNIYAGAVELGNKTISEYISTHSRHLNPERYATGSEERVKQAVLYQVGQMLVQQAMNMDRELG